MHHKGKETEKLNANMFAFNHTCLHFFLVCQHTNNQTTKEKCKLAFKGTRVIKNKRLCLIEIKHTGNHIYAIICLQTIKYSNIRNYM